MRGRGRIGGKARRKREARQARRTPGGSRSAAARSERAAECHATIVRVCVVCLQWVAGISSGGVRGGSALQQRCESIRVGECACVLPVLCFVCVVVLCFALLCFRVPLCLSLSSLSVPPCCSPFPLSAAALHACGPSHNQGTMDDNESNTPHNMTRQQQRKEQGQRRTGTRIDEARGGGRRRAGPWASASVLPLCPLWALTDSVQHTRARDGTQQRSSSGNQHAAQDSGTSGGSGSSIASEGSEDLCSSCNLARRCLLLLCSTELQTAAVVVRRRERTRRCIRSYTAAVHHDSSGGDCSTQPASRCIRGEEGAIPTDTNASPHYFRCSPQPPRAAGAARRRAAIVQQLPIACLGYRSVTVRHTIPFAV